MTKPIFVDAGAWIGLINDQDQYHKVSKEYFEELEASKIPLITSNFILSETYTRLKRKVGSKVAILFGEKVLASSLLKVITVDRQLEKRAWDIFKKYSDQTFSYTDCTSFALMRERKIQDAFAFDNDFRIFGFNLLPTP